MMKRHKPIPASHSVQPLEPGDEAIDQKTCLTCGLSWDDGKSTSITPAPAGRCPFEYFHIYEKEHKLRYYEQCPYTVKKFKTDSGNDFFLFFKTGSIREPLFVLTDGEMEAFYANVEAQTRGQQWRSYREE